MFELQRNLDTVNNFKTSKKHKEEVFKKLLLNYPFFDYKLRMLDQIALFLNMERDPLYIKARSRMADFLETLGKFVNDDFKPNVPEPHLALPKLETLKKSAKLQPPNLTYKKHLRTLTEIKEHPEILEEPPIHSVEREFQTRRRNSISETRRKSEKGEKHKLRKSKSLTELHTQSVLNNEKSEHGKEEKILEGAEASISGSLFQPKYKIEFKKKGENKN
ncbi:hypothetical protein EIN_273690 [Entamoeba invadens IP1]|uniref:Uncharacterized protein n=1 Tax=Entamoeba invadens IP1 TaxID=370355 RepID=A0A0A1U1E6_ENTIV|nr:hypothetical protein EIN_273690 [Entamoeba invadens IP1]ELP87832.1 hypothetical protein EIN_273690 [Entamoeba invadens IP1]|eukprot:XP_004254603.1 hypothetical protein EIN_273690 [Entamoeba invadens IP1]